MTDSAPNVKIPYWRLALELHAGPPSGRRGMPAPRWAALGRQQRASRFPATRSIGKGIRIDRNQRINEQIRISPVRVITADGELLGILNTDEALAKAREADLDLVEVAPNERPPVCRIMDYGKFKYQQRKRQAKGHTHQSKIKEIRVRPKTGEHDIGFKLNQARTFLQHKDKVIVSVIFRGREMAHIEEGRKVIDHVIKELEEVGKVEAPPSHQGKRIVCILAPR